MIGADLPPPEEVYGILESLNYMGITKPGSARVVDVGSEKFLSFFEKEILDDYISKGGSTCRVFEGVYGSGKSHLLQLIEELAINKGYIVCRIELKHDLDFSKNQLITKHILENCQALIRGERIKRLPDIIGAASEFGTLDIENLKSAHLHHSCAKNAVHYAVKRSTLDERAWSELRRYLLGEKVLVRDLKKVGLIGIKKPLTEKNSEQFLNTIINSIYILGFQGLILLYDETDRSWASSGTYITKKVQSGANIIRRFIDACSFGDIKGTMAIFAVLPNFIQDCTHCYPALGQRLARFDDTGPIKAWRWPILPVRATNSIILDITKMSEEKIAFFEEVKKKYRLLIDYCGGDLDGIDDEFDLVGIPELNKTAGEEYRRQLIKIMSNCALNRIERSGKLF